MALALIVGLASIQWYNRWQATVADATEHCKYEATGALTAYRVEVLEVKRVGRYPGWVCDIDVYMTPAVKDPISGIWIIKD